MEPAVETRALLLVVERLSDSVEWSGQPAPPLSRGAGIPRTRWAGVPLPVLGRLGG